MESRPPVDPEIERLFRERDPLRIMREILDHVALDTGIGVQDFIFNLPRVFEDRRFQIVALDGREIDSVFDLRSPQFHGFYLIHFNESKLGFVYACRGARIEWTPSHSVIQPSAGAEAAEFKEYGLRGLAREAAGGFVFVVESVFREWARRHEKACAEIGAHFVTIAEFAGGRAGYQLIWPKPE